MNHDYWQQQTEAKPLYPDIEWGKPEIAHTMARVTVDARDACLEYGLTPATSGYKSCMERETHARRLLVFTDDPQYDREIAEQ